MKILWYLLMISTSLSLSPHYTFIDSPVIKLVDGTGVIKINQILYFIQFIQGLKTGFKPEVFHLFVDFLPDVPADQREVIKTFPFKGTYYTLEELVKIEEHLSTLSPEDASNDAKELKDILEYAIDAFERLSTPYLAQAKGARYFMIQIIKRWSELVNKPHTYLLAWNKNATNEKEHMYHDLTTLKSLSFFFEDLQHFLVDFVYSCKDSYADYKKRHTK